MSNDPKIFWQSQTTEPSIMTPEQLQSKTEELGAKTRRELLRGLATPLVVVGITAMGIAWFDSPPLRAACATALAWNLAGQYFLNRGAREKTGVPVGIESYCGEVERRRHLSQGFLLWSLGPAIFATATFTVPLVNMAARNAMLIRATPFLTLLAVWVIAVGVARIRYIQALRREIDQLNAQTREG